MCVKAITAGLLRIYLPGRKGALRIACVPACVLGQFLAGCTRGGRTVSHAPESFRVVLPC